MRVLYIIDSLITGGAETSLAQVAGGYRDVGIELHVAFLRDRWDVAPLLTGAGAVLHPVELEGSRVTQSRALTRTIRQMNPDLVHTTLYEADVLGRLAAAVARRPSVTTFASSAYSADHYANPSVRRSRLAVAQAVDMASCRLAQRFHAVSGSVANDMAQRLHLTCSKIDVIPRARDRTSLGEPSTTRRIEVREGLGLTLGQPVLLVVARHEYEKGIDIALRTIAQVRDAVPNLVLLVAGRESRETHKLHRLSESLAVDDRVRMLGRRNDVPDLVVASDIVLVTSRTEGFPGAVIEAMALERPVVASDIPPVREALGDVPAGLAPVGDSSALAAEVQRLLEPRDALAAGQAGRERFDALYTPLPVARRMRLFYDRALEVRVSSNAETGHDQG